MSEELYDELLSLVTPLIQKQNTIMREAISPHERLTATMRYLVEGKTQTSLQYSILISRQTLGRIIPETCRAIYGALKNQYMKMSIKVQKITEPVRLGEGPHWDEKQQALYFVSIPEHTIHKYVPATGAHTKTKVDGRVGFIVPVEGTSDQYLVGVERKFLVVKWDGAEGSPTSVVSELGEVDSDVPTNRINDGKADPRGRVFAGTMGREDPPGNFERQKGSLFRLDGSKITKIVDGVSISNGLAWDLQQKAMYYTDSMEKNIRRYDYDVETGKISNLKYIFDFEKNKVEGVPDGSTIDTDGNLWVAVFDGSCVIKIDPRTGELLQKVPIPALQVTSVTFGGPNYDILFVVTASLNIGGPQEPPCGSTFMVTGLGVKGLPNVNFKL